MSVYEIHGDSPEMVHEVPGDVVHPRPPGLAVILTDAEVSPPSVFGVTTIFPMPASTFSDDTEAADAPVAPSEPGKALLFAG